MTEPRRWNDTTGFVTWPHLHREPMQKGWQCGACGIVLAPWVASHECVKTDAPDMLYKAGWEFTTDPAERGQPGKLWAGGSDPDDALYGLSSAKTLAGDANT